ncbi:MAG TPA: histidine kinase [Streptosporangiaceae bacterium]
MNAFPLSGHPPAHSVRWWMFDVLVTVLVASLSLPYHVHEHVWPSPLTILVQVALTVPLVVRRIWPSAVFGWLFAVSAVAGLWNVRLVVSFALVVALYTVAAYQSRRRALEAAGLLEGGVAAAVIRLTGSGWWHGAILGTGMVAAALGLGLYSATRRAYLKELHDRAERLERERDQQKELAAAAERGRITREMHDIVAHNLAVMIALSDGAAAASARSSPQAAKAMRTVSATGRQALADTRRLLSGPATDAGQDSEREPLPDLSGLDALVARVRAAGLPVSYELQGAPAPLSAGVQLTVYRLVQEALTNTLKHAGAGASAVVRLWYLPGELRLVVEDDGAGASAPQPDTGGRGLAGMRQRVQTFGGEVQAGPRSPAGWRVSALLRLDQEIPA